MYDKYRDDRVERQCLIAMVMELGHTHLLDVLSGPKWRHHSEPGRMSEHHSGTQSKVCVIS